MRAIPIIFGLLSLLLVTACQEPVGVEADSEPPLFRAAEQGDLPSLDQLLAGSTAVDLRDHCQWTPLMKAALHGHTAVARRLLEAGARVNATDQGGYSALMLAASNNHADVIRLLAEEGADPNLAEPGLGWTALIWAAKQGHAAAVAALLEQGAVSQATDLAGNTAADWARRNRHRQVLALLQQ